MVPDGSRRIHAQNFKVSRTFCFLQQASTSFKSVEWILLITLKTKLTSYYAQWSANNWSCLTKFLTCDQFWCDIDWQCGDSGGQWSPDRISRMSPPSKTDFYTFSHNNSGMESPQKHGLKVSFVNLVAVAGADNANSSLNFLFCDF